MQGIQLDSAPREQASTRISYQNKIPFIYQAEGQ
jgi:hypothetical protein